MTGPAPARSAQFREFAFVMAAGVLIDSFIVRSLLVPALISLFGTASGWPGRRLSRRRAAVNEAAGSSRAAAR